MGAMHRFLFHYYMSRSTENFLHCIDFSCYNKNHVFKNKIIEESFKHILESVLGDIPGSFFAFAHDVWLVMSVEFFALCSELCNLLIGDVDNEGRSTLYIEILIFLNKFI